VLVDPSSTGQVQCRYSLRTLTKCRYPISVRMNVSFGLRRTAVSFRSVLASKSDNVIPLTD
jgi:hypothetical protein